MSKPSRTMKDVADLKLDEPIVAQDTTNPLAPFGGGNETNEYVCNRLGGCICVRDNLIMSACTWASAPVR